MKKLYLSLRLFLLLIIPAIFIALFFQPAHLNFTFSPTNNSSTISTYASQVDNFNQEITRWDFINLQFIKYNLYLNQNIQVLDQEKDEVLQGALLYNDLSNNQQQINTTSTRKIGSNLSYQAIVEFVDQFGNAVQWTYTIYGTHTIPPHSAIAFISHAVIQITIWPTLASYIYLYLLTLAALIGLIILTKEAWQFVFKGSAYFNG